MLPASIQSLPLELLCEIFLYTLPIPIRRTVNPLETPLLLSHVCKRWKDIAYKMPTLWDSHWSEPRLREERLTSLREDAKTMKEISDFWFDHSSKHRPFYQRVSWQIPVVVQELRHIAFPVRSNVRELYIDVSQEISLDAMFHVPTEAMNSLESLILKIEDLNLDQLIRFPILQPAPNFHMLCLSMTASVRLKDLNNFQIPWAQMTHVSIDSAVTLRVWHNVVRACPLLRGLLVEFYVNPTDDIFTDEDATLLQPVKLSPELEELSLRFSDGGIPVTSAILTNVTFPPLIHLTIENLFPFCFSMEDQVLNFYQQVGPRLQTLCLIQQDMQADDLIPVLRMAPLLKELEFDGEGNHDALLSELDIPSSDIDGPQAEGGQILVPKLERFSLSILEYDRSVDAYPVLSAGLYGAAIRSRHLRSKKATIDGDSAAVPPPSTQFQAELTVGLTHKHIIMDIYNLLEPLRYGGLKFQFTRISGPLDPFLHRLSSKDVYNKWRHEMGFPDVQDYELVGELGDIIEKNRLQNLDWRETWNGPIGNEYRIQEYTARSPRGSIETESVYSDYVGGDTEYSDDTEDTEDATSDQEDLSDSASSST